jgi:hypothetical protein
MLSPDGTLLVVASTEMPGFGASDLYVLRRTAAGWSDPVNLGSSVNGGYSEFAPSFSPDGATLYFTSERPGIVGTFPPNERRPGDLYEIAVADVPSLLVHPDSLAVSGVHADSRKYVATKPDEQVSRVGNDTRGRFRPIHDKSMGGKVEVN